MQLPRGTFRSIKKGVKLGETLNELSSSRFTGISTLSSASSTGILVFRNGACVLAKIQNRYGNPAWEAVIAQPDLLTDMALSELDGAQLQLALDFNKKAWVSLVRQGGQKPAPVPARAERVQVPARPRHAPPSVNPGRDRDPPRAPRAAEPVPAAPPVQKKTVVPPAPVPEHRWVKAPVAAAVPSPEEDIDPFEDMDLEDVARKIRKDCKIILKQLQLDHLTEN